MSVTHTAIDKLLAYRQHGEKGDCMYYLVVTTTQGRMDFSESKGYFRTRKAVEEIAEQWRQLQKKMPEILDVTICKR